MMGVKELCKMSLATKLLEYVCIYYYFVIPPQNNVGIKKHFINS